MRLLSHLVQTQKTITLAPTVSVRQATQVMADNKIGSILVMDNGQLCGIFSERDLLMRVIAKGLNVDQTSLSEVMTKNVTTVPLEATIQDCFQKMESTKCRRLPILDENRIVGMVTMRNILEWLIGEIEDEKNQLIKYIQS